MMKSTTAVLIGLVLSVMTVPAMAQVQRSGSDASARVMQQLQQLTAEKTSLQQENERLKQQLEDVQGELKQAKAGRDALEAKARSVQAAAQRNAPADTQAQEALERTRGQLQELIGKFRETGQTLRDVEGDRAQLRTQLAQRDREYKVCVDRNVELYALNGEILTKLEDRGFWSSFSSAEPFTRITRTRLENLIDDYRYRAEEMQIDKAGKSALTSAK